MSLPAGLPAANHREAPITALDHKADITDIYAFVSYGGPGAGQRVTFILSVDPLLEPANGPNWFPFDPDILYEIKSRLLAEALRLFPAYHYALAGLAKVRTAQGKHVEAVELLRRRYEAAPHPENLYDLAVALERAGRKEEARRAFASFEAKARAETTSWDNANRELIFYYADHARKPAEALRVAQEEVARRRDVHTLDAYAWALHVNGRHAEARKQVEAALAVGTRDPRLLYHAGAISSKLRDQASAKRYLGESLEVNSRSEVAAEVRRLLASLR